MSRRRRTTTRLPDLDQPLVTTRDTLYEWSRHTSYEGWAKVARFSSSTNPKLMVPHGYSRDLARAALDARAEELEEHLPAGVVLILPGKHSRSLDLLVDLQVARKQHAVPALFKRARSEDWPFFLARLPTSAVLELAADHGLHVVSAALTLKSLEQREDLLGRLGHHRIEQMLKVCQLPEEVYWQVLRSSAFDPDGMADPGTLVGAAGNPRLSSTQQVAVVETLLDQLGEQDAFLVEPPLTRLVSSSGFAEAAALKLTPVLSLLPRKTVLSLAENPVVTWLWLRDKLDTFPDPDVALHSMKVGGMTDRRRSVFEGSQDPVVRAAVGQPLTMAQWDPSDMYFRSIVNRAVNGDRSADWSVESPFVPSDEWGIHSVARQWLARADRYQMAERTLRRVMDLHNRSWGRAGSSLGDPAKAAKADNARALTQFDRVYAFLSIETVGEPVTLEQVRMEAVRMVCIVADEAEDGKVAVEDPHVQALVDAVLDSAACEAAA